MSNGTTTWSYTYDANGMRTMRTNGSRTYTYVYNGSQLSRMTVDGKTMYFTYDATGAPMTLNYNGARYYYITNLQGDVVAIVDSTGTTVVEYTYDAWGNPISITGTQANGVGIWNPLRYRGYVYDMEYELYYLESRYYAPCYFRFISPDAFTSTGQGFTGNNMFAYCGNNPVMGYDPTGQMDWGIFAGGAGLLGIGVIACVAAITVASGGACTPLLVAACATFAVGGMTVLNGAAEIGESITDYNYMRDGIYGGNSGFYQSQREVFATASVAGTVALGASANSFNICFVEGTFVLSKDGMQPIEQIKKGDSVWSWNEESGEIELKQVTETYVNSTTELLHVFVGEKEIITTPEHPFYIPIKGWTSAAKLKAGDILVLVNGEYVVVERIQHEILEAPIKVYNFQVEDNHTYYVSALGVLVHNSCNHNYRWRLERISYWQNQACQVELEHDYGSYIATEKNIDRMMRGLAPIGWDDRSVQLHHWNGIVNDFYNYSPVSRTLHLIIHSTRK